MELTGDDRLAVEGRSRLTRLASHGRSPIAVHRIWGRVVRLASSLLPIGPAIITPRPSLAGAHRNPAPRRESLADPGLSPRPPRARTHSRATVVVPLQAIGKRAEHRFHLALSSLHWGWDPYVRFPRGPRADLHLPRSESERRAMRVGGREREGQEECGRCNRDERAAHFARGPMRRSAYRFAEEPRISIYRDAPSAPPFAARLDESRRRRLDGALRRLLPAPLVPLFLSGRAFVARCRDLVRFTRITIQFDSAWDALGDQSSPRAARWRLPFELSDARCTSVTLSLYLQLIVASRGYRVNAANSFESEFLQFSLQFLDTLNWIITE